MVLRIPDAVLPLPFPEGTSWHTVLEYRCLSQHKVPATSLTYTESDMGLLLVRGREEQAVAPEPSEQPTPRRSSLCQKVSGPVAVEEDGEGE